MDGWMDEKRDGWAERYSSALHHQSPGPGRSSPKRGRRIRVMSGPLEVENEEEEENKTNKVKVE